MGQIVTTSDALFGGKAMARPFSSTDAKRLLEWHHKTIEKLHLTESSAEGYRE